MGVFDDHKLEQLDWMTQMTETIDSDLNSLLAKLPDRTLITAKDIIESSSSSYLSFSVRYVLSKQIKALVHGHISYEEERILEKCFAFASEGDICFDLRNETLSGEIAMVKIVATLSDEELLPIMGKRGLEEIARCRNYSENNIERLNEVLDILGGCGEAMRNRSGRKKLEAIRDRLTTIFATNEWRIRDMSLANKVGFWIKNYITNGSLVHLVNLTKLKVMTLSNMPIYSVKEEQ